MPQRVRVSWSQLQLKLELLFEAVRISSQQRVWALSSPVWATQQNKKRSAAIVRGTGGGQYVAVCSVSNSPLTHNPFATLSNKVWEVYFSKEVCSFVIIVDCVSACLWILIVVSYGYTTGWMMESLPYYSFWVFKLLSDIQYGHILNSYNVCMKIFLEHPALINRRNVVLLHDNARPLSPRITQKRNVGFRQDGSNPSTIFTRPYTKWFSSFSSLQNAPSDTKFSQEDQKKTFEENCLSWKPAEFYLRRINKLLDKLRWL